MGGVGSVQYGRVKKNGAVADDPGGSGPMWGAIQAHMSGTLETLACKRFQRESWWQNDRGAACVSGGGLPSGTTGKEN